MARHKPTNRTETILALNWGTPAGNRTPSESMARGVGHKSAIAAGVTRDHHLTPMAQNLAIELEEHAKKMEREADPRSPFEKKYNIYDGEAHLAGGVFADLCRTPEIFKTIETRTKTIHIYGGGQFRFTFKEPGQSYEGLPILRLSVAKRYGVNDILNRYRQAVLCSDQKIFGLLENPNLNFEAKLNPLDCLSKAEYLRLEYPQNKGNYSALFQNASGLERALEERKGPVDVTVTRLSTDNSGPLKIGTLHPVDPAKFDIKERRYTCADLMRMYRDYDPSKQGEREYISQSFYRSARFIITKKGSPLALFERDGAAAQEQGPAPII